MARYLVMKRDNDIGVVKEEQSQIVCSICYDSQTGDWKTIVKTGNISMFGPTFCCKKVASRAIEVAKEWLSYNGLAPKDVFF